MPPPFQKEANEGDIVRGFRKSWNSWEGTPLQKEAQEGDIVRGFSKSRNSWSGKPSTRD